MSDTTSARANAGQLRRAAERVDAFQTALICDVLADVSCAQWERRALEFEAARPRRGDYYGRATPAQLTARYEELTRVAAACRARATVCEPGEFEIDVDHVLAGAA